MANLRFWRYLRALFSSQSGEHGDPRAQIEQAVKDAQLHHQAFAQSAAAVVQNARTAEIRLSRRLGEIEKLQASIRQAHLLGTEARESGDPAKAEQYEQAARSFIAQLGAADSALVQLKSAHSKAQAAASKAKDAVESNARLLSRKIAERNEILTALEQAKLQEQSAAAVTSISNLGGVDDTGSDDMSRDWIIRRYVAELHSTRSTLEHSGDLHAQSFGVAVTSPRLEQIRACLGARKRALGFKPTAR